MTNNIRKFIVLLTALALGFLVMTPIANAQATKRRQRTASRKTNVPTERVDRRARILNRATALAMLKEAEPGRPSKWITWWSLPLSGPQLATISRVIGWGQPNDIAEREHLLVQNLEFYKALVEGGILTGPSTSLTDIPDAAGKYATLYFFGVVQGPGIEKFGSDWGNHVTFTIARYSFTQVTGIYQEAGAATATVAATVSLEPTELYLSLSKVVASVSAKQTLPRDSRYNPIWAGFPAVAELYKVDTQQRTFVRFDDGWRCCR